MAQPLWTARLDGRSHEEHRAASADRLGAVLEVASDLFLGPPRPRSETMERLGQRLEDADPRVQLGAAVALSFTLDIPLSLTGLPTSSDPTVSACAAIALGMAARDGSAFATRLVVRRLAGEVDDDDTHALPAAPLAEAEHAALVQGLGDGLLDEGLGWFLTAATHARREREAWSCATRRVWEIAARAGSAHEPALRRLLLQTASRRCRARLDRVAAALGVSPEDLAADLAATWWDWPPSVRAELLATKPALARAARPVWARDRSTAVAKAVLDTFEGSTAPVDRDDQRGLAELLDHEDPTIRDRALSLLAQQQRRPAVSCPTQESREGAVVVFPHQPPARTALDSLRAAIHRGDIEALPDLLPAVAAVAPAEATRGLIAALVVPDMALRRVAIAGLAVLGGLPELPVVLDAGRRLRTLEGSVAAAVHALARGSSDGVDPAARTHQPQVSAIEELVELFDRRLKWADDAAVDLLMDLGGADALLPSLLRALDTRFYPAARSGAARAAGRHRVGAAAFALRRLVLLDPHPDVRGDAAAALVTLGTTPPRPEEQAGFALSHAALADLPAAARRAAEAGVPALPGLRRVLEDSTWKRRRAACDALAGIPGDRAHALLIRALQDEDEDVRLAALGALERRGWRPETAREQTLAALARREPQALLQQPGPPYMAAVWEALSLGGHVFRSEVARFVALAGAKPPTPAARAALHVAQLDPAAAIEETGGLAEVLQALDRTWQAFPHRDHLARPLRRVPAQALGEVLQPGRAHWRAREAICGALARPGDDEAAAVLARCVTDEDDDVRAAALDALAVVATPAAARAAARGARSPFREDRLPVAETLAAVGVDALPTIDALAQSAWWEERQVAAMALTQWRGPRRVAADRLLPLATDPELRVAMAATDGLRAHGAPPSSEAAARAMATAHPEALAPLVGWLGLEPRRRLDPERATALRGALEALDGDRLAQRLGVVSLLRAEPLAPWVGSLRDHAHAGVRLAAREVARALEDLACQLCGGRGSVQCPACRGSGERSCPRCDGRGVRRSPCPDPDCNAAATTRSIHSRACATCRGRGWVHVACTCGNGAVRCDRCDGAGRFRCPLCDGTGAP